METDAEGNFHILPFVVKVKILFRFPSFSENRSSVEARWRKGNFGKRGSLCKSHHQGGKVAVLCWRHRVGVVGMEDITAVSGCTSREGTLRGAGGAGLQLSLAGRLDQGILHPQTSKDRPHSRFLGVHSESRPHAISAAMARCLVRDSGRTRSTGLWAFPHL